jgi:uncharacterized surface protein with fasciclin (FAS1) repeats
LRRLISPPIHRHKEEADMTMQRRTLLLGAALGATTTLLAACGGGDEDHNPLDTIVGVAQANSDFSILVEAVIKADLVGTLSGTGPFTVFAPTDAAFAAALAELSLTKQQLLDSPLLADILKYHVVSGRVLKADVPVNTDIPTVLGETETLRISSTFVITDEAGRTANITATDVLASNGVIHVIDRVILPSAFAPT